MDNYKIASLTKNGMMAICFATLVSCGGGSGGGSGSGSGGISGLPADFDIFEQTGTWRLNSDIDTTFVIDDLFPGITITVDSEIQNMLVGAIQFNSSNDIVFDFCDGFAPLEIELDDVASDDPFDDDADLVSCSASSANYTKISDNSYRIDYSCDGDVSTILFTRLSNTVDFDFGNLSFTSVDYPNLSSSNGVCGSTIDLYSNTVYTPKPNMFTDIVEDEYTLSVVSPYNGAEILFDFIFFGDPAAGVTYSVVDEADSSNEVAVTVSSATFGGSAALPDFVEGTSGTVTINSISTNAASGSFDFTTDEGDTLVGSFDFDIQ